LRARLGERRVLDAATLLALGLILLLGGYFRFHGLDWDTPQGAEHSQHLHPDERFLSITSSHIDWPDGAGGYFDTGKSPLNPYAAPETHSFVYGTFPLFLAKGVAALADDDSYDTTVTWGRRLTALFDTATIALVFGIGALLFGRRAGLAGALFYALAVLPTQLAHFWTADPFLTFFGAATVLQSALLLRTNGTRLPWLVAAGAGVTLGLAVACKVNGVLFAGAPVSAAVLRVALRDLPRLGLRLRGSRPPLQGHWMTEVSVLALIMAVAIVVFRVAQPYAFAGPHIWDMALNTTWRDDIQREFNFQNGDVGFPPFIQFAGRSPFLTPLRNVVLFGLGPALGLAACLSVVAAGVALFRRRELAPAIPLVVAAAVFGFQGPRFVAFMRYFEPIYPILCLFAGWGTVSLVGAAGTWRARTLPDMRFVPRLTISPRLVRWASGAVAVGLVAATAWWAMAFQSIYSRPNTRIEASAWIYRNVPQGASITFELWDDPVPLDLAPDRLQSKYRIIETHPYDVDSPQKVPELVYGKAEANSGGLNQADYVAITSNRVRDSVRRLERSYPSTIRYYDLLDSGALGFERVATFTAHPTFLGLSINDSNAEESFTVYDHPEVRLYRKTRDWNPDRAFALLDAANPDRAVALLPRQGRSNGLQFTAAQGARQQAGGTFADVFDAHGWASHMPWLWWLVWLELAAFATVPWATWLFRALPDRGYGLAKMLGITSVALPVWLIVAWGGADFSGRLAWAVFAVVLAAGVLLGALRRRALAEDLRSRWPSWLAMECGFLAAFFGFLALRFWNPDLWHGAQGGEKPMEIAYLTAVTRSTEFPPYDPWFGGGTMNYYYMGWFFLAVPIRALKLVPEIAFNMGVPTFAALCVSIAFSTVHNLVALTRGAGRRLPGPPGGWARPAILAGVAGSVFLAGIANLDGAHQTIERLQEVNHWTLFEGVPILGGAVGLVGGLARWLFGGGDLPPFDWWRSSRVHFGEIDITEFPYWSFLFGDLHPHLMGLPFFGLAIALATAYVVTAVAGLRGRCWLLAVALGAALGLERTVHTWDFPTALLIAGGGVVAGQILASGRWQSRWWSTVGHLVVIALVMQVAFAPYLRHFETFEPGLMRAEHTTMAHQYFVQFGLFLAVALGFLAVRYHEEIAVRPESRNPVLAIVRGKIEVGALAVFVTGLTVFTWQFGLTVVALSILIELFLVNLLWFELRAAERDVARLLATSMYALAFAIAAGVDVVTVQPDIERMNTVFKFGLQAWQLFALASAYAAWYVGRSLWQADGWRARPLPGRRAAAWGAGAVFGLLLVGSSLYLVSGTRARQDARFAALSPTLDGLAYLPSAAYVENRGTYDNPADDVIIRPGEDEPLIRWLRANVKGSPIVAEAVGPLYSWTTRIANNTGLPAVVGWDWHQIQQRTDYDILVQRRRSDTQQFFSDPRVDLAADYLRRYNVSYVVVGTEERVYGTDAGLAKFAHMPGLTEVFRSGPNAIYRVDQSHLGGQ